MKNMKRLVLVLVMVSAVLASGAVAARDGRRRGRQPEESFIGALVRECKLTAKQQTAVKDKIKARDVVLAKWDKANAEKVTAAEAASKEARSGGDAEKKKQAFAAVRALKTARQEAGAETTAAVLTVLTPEQKIAWGGYELYKSLAGRYRRAELTEAQQAQVRTACGFAAKDIAAIDPDDSKAKKTKNAVTQKLQWAINALVLNDEQRKAMASQPNRGGRKKKDQ
jgi:Spy/CpxP family protein refolding chaperone